ncbi:hypothetical protein HGG76_08090 [Ochrobactrum tritici]|uniref:Uncharacterized protein n=1 Tax=Brucella tritici TaxID=94626 RepID=A0A7X6FPT6_9HYPH|nr:hypothetical protein [Brucella tritici]
MHHIQKSAENNTLGKRIIHGKTADVAPNIIERHGELQHKTDQSDNEWAARALPVHKELAEKLAEIRSIHVEVQKMRSELENAKMRTVEAENCIEFLQNQIKATQHDRDGIRKNCPKQNIPSLFL